MKLLLVEDDLDLAAGLSKALKREGFSVDSINNGTDAINSVNLCPPDIVILDLGLPDIDGLTVLKRIRAKGKTLPILVLTARDGLQDKVNTLDEGADDFLAKPFEIDELLARLRVLARRLSTCLNSDIHVGPVRLDLAQHFASVNDSEIKLSRREFMLLKALVENIDRIQTKDALEHKLYGWGEEVSSNSIEVHISNLRKKLPKDFITTVRGVGYTVKSKVKNTATSNTRDN